MQDDITLWLQEVKRGEARSQQELWNAYFQKLVSLARAKLRSAKKRDYDEEDIALSAFNSFFRAVDDQRLPKLDDRHDLWKVLVTITVRKILDQRKRDFALKRGEGQVRGESVFQQPGLDEALGMAQVLGAEPTPELAATVTEEFNELMQQLPDQTYRRIAQLKMEGYTNLEISRQLGCVERTVERKLKLIRNVWDS
ncbi:RNA polymerase subunit sigma-70 [Rhodopirellula sp. SM50]|nr:ECF-type sigma factor [Rhodopirellula sp. SM50]PAY20402.1 RNA polymerase subunit sigma-70 [Rhodopirellula sp. SM50]